MIKPIPTAAKSSDDQVGNVNFSPASFAAIKSLMHLYPMWSILLQQSSLDSSETPIRLLSNSVVENHFRSVKHGRLGNRGRVRPRIFLEQELSYCKGKLNELLLPQKSSRKQAPRKPSKKNVGQLCTEEKWRKRKKAAKYSDHNVANRILERVKQVTNKVLPKKPENDHVVEYDDNDIEQHLRLLRTAFPNVGGLQPTCLGQSSIGNSVPKFQAIDNGTPFVQIFHNSDHWVCATNIFSDEPTHIYIYDSSYTTVQKSTIIQLSSLLRVLSEERDYITISVRRFKQQTLGTRLCGLYAVAVAIACCNGVDMSGYLFDETVLTTKLASNLSMASVEEVPALRTNDSIEVKKMETPMLFCLCQSRRTADMISCTICRSPYHRQCIQKSNDVDVDDSQWCGPCCNVVSTEHDDVIDITEGESETPKNIPDMDSHRRVIRK